MMIAMKSIITLLLVGNVSSYSSSKLFMSQKPTTDFGTVQHRRGFFRTLTSVATTASLSSLAAPKNAIAAESSALTDVYFGVGCFWHIQHEFVEAERKLLGRADKELTSRTGYAGGTKNIEGKVSFLQSFRILFDAFTHENLINKSIAYERSAIITSKA